MSLVLTTNESPQAVKITRSYGPPLPANETIFTMPQGVQARVVSYDVRVFSAINGVLFSNISLHEPGGGIVFIAALAPLPNIFFFASSVERAFAGPEQARVPFFTPNILLGTIPKDLYALPGYEFRFNNVAGLAGRSADVTIFLTTGND